MAFSRISLSPLPVQPLEYPCLSTFLSVKKGDWSFDPDYIFGKEAKPWMIDSWIHYSLYHKKKWQVVAGVNPFLYFTATNADLQKQGGSATRNLSGELSADYKILRHWSVNLDYRCDRGFNHQMMSGSFICASLSAKTDISRSLGIRINGHAAYLDYPCRFHALIGSGEMILESKKLPASISLQMIEPLLHGSSPFAFLWNTAVAISW